MKSEIKTFLKRNGFKGEGFAGNRTPIRSCRGYVERNNRKFRIRHANCMDKSTPIVVDVGETIDKFDRWANSVERTISINDFFKEFGRLKP